MTAARTAPEYLTSRDAAALLGIPERRIRQLIRDGTLDGFRSGGYWILPAGQLTQRHGGPPDSAAAVRADYPAWRVCELSSGYAAVLDTPPPRRPVVLSGFNVPALRAELERWHRSNGLRP